MATLTKAELRARKPCALKPPPLDGAYGMLPETRAEWRRWFTSGYASAWGPADVSEARRLLDLVDAYGRANGDLKVRIRLAAVIRAGRQQLGLSGPSPLEDAKPLQAREYIDSRPDPRLSVSS
jgi:hypothetical protein